MSDAFCTESVTCDLWVWSHCSSSIISLPSDIIFLPSSQDDRAVMLRKESWQVFKEHLEEVACQDAAKDMCMTVETKDMSSSWSRDNKPWAQAFLAKLKEARPNFLCSSFCCLWDGSTLLPVWTTCYCSVHIAIRSRNLMEKLVERWGWQHRVLSVLFAFHDLLC